MDFPEDARTKASGRFGCSWEVLFVSAPHLGAIEAEIDLPYPETKFYIKEGSYER
jgi:hypothetical protein